MQTWAKFYATVHLGTMNYELCHGQTMCCTFCDHLQHHSCSVFDIKEFSWNWFFTDCIRQKNRMQSQCRLVRDIFLAAWNKLHHHKAHVYKMMYFLDHLRSCVCCLDSGLWVASFVRMWHDILLLHNWDNNIIIYFVHKLTTLNHLGFGMLTMETATCMYMHVQYIS